MLYLYYKDFQRIASVPGHKSNTNPYIKCHPEQGSIPGNMQNSNPKFGTNWNPGFTRVIPSSGSYQIKPDHGETHIPIWILKLGPKIRLKSHKREQLKNQIPTQTINEAVALNPKIRIKSHKREQLKNKLQYTQPIKQTCAGHNQCNHRSSRHIKSQNQAQIPQTRGSDSGRRL